MSKNKILSLVLAFVMLVSSFTPVLASSKKGVGSPSKAGETVGKELEVTTARDSMGRKKNVIKLGSLKKSELSRKVDRFGYAIMRPMGMQQGPSFTARYTDANIHVSLETFGISGAAFDWDEVFGEGGTFKVQACYYDKNDNQTSVGSPQTISKGMTELNIKVSLPMDANSINIESDFIDKLGIKAYEVGNVGEGDGEGNFKIKLELHQIYNPVLNVIWINPYGTKVRGSSSAKASFNEVGFNIVDSNSPMNLRDEDILIKGADGEPEDFIEDHNLTDLTDKNLEIVGANQGKVTYDNKTYKVTVKKPTAKDPGEIKFVEQPKIITPGGNEKPGDYAPEGYKRLSFHAESAANEQDGLFADTTKLKVVDVLEGTEFNDADLLNKIKEIGQPHPIINGKADPNKKFLKWNPALPTAETSGKVQDTDYYPVYLANGDEVEEGEKLPEGVHKVKVLRDETSIKENSLYGKTYAVFDGKTLAREKFPKLETNNAYKDPKWTTEAAEAGKPMEKIDEPWAKLINKDTTFKATAAEDAATQIKKEGLKAVDTTALQGQELDEKFWHKGVALADNVEEAKRAKFEELLKDATVTDKSSRTSEVAGDFIGNLLVTFKDGSALEVENQKLIVKPNTVEVTFDKAEGEEKPLRDGDTTVKGTISASSNSAEFPVSLEGALVTIKKGDTVLSRTLANADGSFVAGVKNPLAAGEDISVVVTLPETKAESKPVTEKVGLNPDKLNSIIPTGKEVFNNFKDKKGVKQELVQKLKEALDEASNLVDAKGKVLNTVPVTAQGQASLNTAYENIKKAIAALTGNNLPSIEGPNYKEIFVGKDLDLTEGIIVKDEDGSDDLVKYSDGKNYTIEAEKVTDTGNVKVVDLDTIKDNVGTYKVTYTAKDISGATATHTMELAVKEIKVTKIEVTTDPTKDQKYLVANDAAKATPDYTGMVVTLTKNDGTTETAKYDNRAGKFKVGEKAIDELTVEPTSVGITGKEPQRIIAKYTKGESNLTAEATKKIIVQLDKDGDGVADEEQDFDIKKAVKIEVLTDPAKMTYKQGENLDPKGMVVQVTDKAGKVKVADVTDDSWKDKFTFDPNENLQAPDPAVANGETNKHVTVTVKDVEYEQKPVSAKTKGTLKVLIDADGDGIDDRTQTTDKPFITAARNIPKSKDDKTPKTLVEGIAKPGVKIEIKAADENGAPTGDVLGTVAAVGADGTYEVALNPKQNAGTKLVAIATEGEKKPSNSDPRVVIDDMDEDGNDDNEQGFNIAKATDIKFVEEPDLTYLVKTKETEVTFDGKDGKGKGIYLELSYKNGEKTESKIMTLEDLMKDTVHILVTPAKGTKATYKDQYDAEGNALQNATLVGKNIEVKLVKANPEAKAISTSKFAIDIDADENGIADKTETTATPTVRARNIGENPIKTTVEGTAPKGSTVTIKYTPEGGKETTKTVTAGEDGKYKAEIEPKLPVDTEVKVTAKDGEKKESPEVKTKVFDDKDNDGKDDRSQNFDITKAVKIEMVYDPAKMNYLVRSQDARVALETKGMVVKVTDKAGVEKKFTAEEIAADTTHFTVEPKEGSEIGLSNNNQVIKVSLNVASATTKEAYTSMLTVKLDKDGNGVADDQEQFEIEKATKVEILQNPNKMNYSVKTKDGKTPFDATGVIIRLTDDSGKTATYTYADITSEENKGKFTLSPADKEEIGLKEDGSVNTIPFKVTVTGAKAQPSVTADENITVILDKDENGVDDRTEKTAEPDVTARNIGKDPSVTTVEVETEKNADVTIEYRDANGDTKTITGKADDQGKLTYEITPKLEKGTPVKVTVKDGEKQATEKTVNVFDDLDDNKISDDLAGRTERPAAIASNVGSKPEHTTIKGKTEPGAVITVKVKDGSEEKAVDVKEFNIDTEGNYTLQATVGEKPLENGAEILVYAQNAPKTISEPQTTTVFKDVDGDGKPDGGKVDLEDVKDIQVIAPDKILYTQGDKLDATGLKAVIRDNKGGIEIFEYDNTTGKFKNVDGTAVDAITATVNADAIAKVKTEGNKDIVEPLTLTKVKHNGKAIDVKVGDKTGSSNQKLEVIELQTPTPTIEFAANQNEPGLEEGSVSETAKDKTTVKFTVVNVPVKAYIKYKIGGVDKTDVVTFNADDEKTKVVDLSYLVPEGDPVEIIAIEDGKTESDPARENVIRDADNDGKADPKYLPEPIIKPVKDKDSTVSGTAENADAVDIYKKANGSDEWVLIKENETVSKDKFTYTDPAPFNDGDEIKVVAKKHGYVNSEARVTVGVDTSGLDKAIADGRDELEKRNDGTKADKDLEKAIQEGEKVKNDPKSTQDDVDKAKNAIEKAIEEKKKTDDARDRLKEKIKEAEDKKDDPEYEFKPKYIKDELDESAKDGQKTHDNIESSKEEIDKAIEMIQEKLDEYNKQQIGVTIEKVVSTGRTIKVITTAPNAKVEVFISKIDINTWETILIPIADGQEKSKVVIINLKNELAKGTNLFIRVSHPDYLSFEDNIIVE